MPQNKRQNGVGGYIITSTIPSLLLSSHFFFSSLFVLAQIDSYATSSTALNQRGDYSRFFNGGGLVSLSHY